MKFNIRLVIYLIVIICTLFGCQRAKKIDYNKLILGHWLFANYGNGVRTYVTFYPDGRMIESFREDNGKGKDRFGEWKIEGDSLFITEKVGNTSHYISQLDDSLLVVLPSHDSLALVFDKVKNIE